MLPNIIFVREEEDKDGPWLYAVKIPHDAIVEDGPTLVGTYKLVGKRKLIKNIHEIKRLKRK